MFKVYRDLEELRYRYDELGRELSKLDRIIKDRDATIYHQQIRISELAKVILRLNGLPD